MRNKLMHVCRNRNHRLGLKGKKINIFMISDEIRTFDDTGIAYFISAPTISATPVFVDAKTLEVET